MTSSERLRLILRAKLRRLAAGAPSATISDDEEVLPPAPFSDKRRDECLAILELRGDANPAEIRAAYRRLCLRYHPDRFTGDVERLQAANQLLSEVNAAYAYLRASAS